MVETVGNSLRLCNTIQPFESSCLGRKHFLKKSGKGPQKLEKSGKTLAFLLCGRSARRAARRAAPEPQGPAHRGNLANIALFHEFFETPPPPLWAFLPQMGLFGPWKKEEILKTPEKIAVGTNQANAPTCEPRTRSDFFASVRECEYLGQRLSETECIASQRELLHDDFKIKAARYARLRTSQSSFPNRKTFDSLLQYTRGGFKNKRLNISLRPFQIHFLKRRRVTAS